MYSLVSIKQILVRHIYIIPNSLVEVDQKGDNIKSNFDESFSCVEGHLSSVHDLCGVVEARPGHGRTLDVSDNEKTLYNNT